MSATATASRRHSATTASPRNNAARRKERERAAAEKRREQLRAYLAGNPTLWTPKTSNGLTFVDIFCGAGGSSIGLSNAGYRLLLAANHWQTAIDTHAANFGDAEHLCADVNNYDFRYLPRGADVLWASPICTEASPAGGTTGYKRGQIPGQSDMLQELGHVSQKGMERTRATFYDVLRATEIHRFKAVLIENVPDVVDRWELFDYWLMGMERLGYTYQLVSVNSAHVGGDGIEHAPQWRDRLYIVFVRKDIGRSPDVTPRPVSRCFTCEQDVPGEQTWAPSVFRKQFRTGRYRRDPKSSYGQYWYTCPNRGCGQRVEPYIRPAASVIDWTDLGVRIGDLPRTVRKPEGLAPKTMDRIRAGLRKYGHRAIQAAVAGNTYERPGYVRAWPVDDQPLGTTQCTNTQALAVPPGAFTVKHYSHQEHPGRMSKGVLDDALGTLTASNSHSVVVPGGAFRVNSNHDDDRIQPLDTQPLAACTTKIGDGMVVPPPMSVPVGGTWAEEVIDLTASPSRTVMANEKGCEALVTPGAFLAVLRNNADAVPLDHPMPTLATARHNALIVPYYTKGVATSTVEPLGTLSTHDRFSMVTPEELAGRAELDAMEAFYRMLKARESLRAQTFPDDYLVLGGSGEQTMQAGNAVSCNVAEWIGRQVAEILLPHAAL
ncbi:DNA cytosine methyltransferase [Micromonospora sp. NPDC049366]|uniref:DNA cytosine methyltransferase n=1 Tax=Micromonospora sp. NPDC049366 TaxID=3364271 RepID=UPI003796BA6A